MKKILLGVLCSTSLLGCATTSEPGGVFGNIITQNQNIIIYNNVQYRVTQVQKSIKSYEEEGIRWGRLHWGGGSKPRLEPDQIDIGFKIQLAERNGLDFFWIHSELKDAFRRGYRIGYQDRTADLVLGPNVSAAAVYIGEKAGNRFVNTIETFEKDWADSIMYSIDVFITLIAEGSQNDREQFVAKFTNIYAEKYKKNQEAIRGTSVNHLSQGGTLLKLDYSQGKLLSALDIPLVDSLKNQFYSQSFIVMGDELGRRFSNNLIKRDELVDLLRRSRTALMESPSDIQDRELRLNQNLGTIRTAFISKFGTDAENVIDGLLKDAGFNYRPQQATPTNRPANKR